ncbi:hypothetical protein MAQ5080_02242 [Marinomonas aquimarina]|uniref:Uncharacterized protein n=1 Tax=Marinomonas aquimarina TaxID=295068 RepID=A0A1A8TJD7_9GAMM|nr:hypothetical protein [Marinomonas aquimarina]SBS32357.1 hypothetical protein MAQ5080_02242 [Marinomonas aquimarina]
MDQHALISFEKGMDTFLKRLKTSLQKHQHVSVCHHSMPQCLESFKVTDEADNEHVLRLVVIGCAQSTALARLSWLDKMGKDHVCCYLNTKFEAVKRKRNGLWVKDKHEPEEMCLKIWTCLHSPI